MVPARFGVNYTPRRGWFHSWLDLDAGEVDEDLAQIAGLGLDHVRIFPLWPLLQPDRTLIPASSVADVLSVADIAGRHGLEVSVDLLQGHLSSFDFLPAWVSTWHRRNIFTDPDVVAAQHELARVLGGELSSRPHVTGMTLGNEIGQFAGSGHPDRSATTSAEATAWTSGLLDTLAETWPAGRHHHSYDDSLWFTDDHPFTPADAVLLGTSTTVHPWVFSGAAQRLGSGHPGLGLYARYVIEVADLWRRLLGGDEDRRIWLQEIGAPTPWITAEDAPAFADTALREAFGNPAVEAATWWCSHDVSRELSDFPELEYTLGLFDSSGNVKPVGEAVSQVARERGGEVRGVAEATATAAAPGASAVDVPTTGPSSSGGSGADVPSFIVPTPALDGSDRSLLAPRGDVFARWVTAALEDGPARLEVSPG